MVPKAVKVDPRSTQKSQNDTHGAEMRPRVRSRCKKRMYVHMHVSMYIHPTLIQEALLLFPSGRATDRAVPFGGEMLEGCVQEGESQLGCKVSCRRVAPDSVPKPPPEPERELRNGFQNELKSSQMESLGESWGHLWPTWVPKRLLERQVGAKMGQVGAKMGQDEVKLGPS